MAEASAAEVNADPNPALFVAKEVDIMVAAADRAELFLGQLAQRAQKGQILPSRVVKELVIARFAVVALSHPKHHRLGDLVHNLFDLGLNIVGAQIGANGFVAARDVVTNPARADGIAVGDHTADRHRVAFVPVGHQGCARYNFVLGAALDLIERRFVVFAPDRNIAMEAIHVLPPFLAEFRGQYKSALGAKLAVPRGSRARSRLNDRSRRSRVGGRGAGKALPYLLRCNRDESALEAGFRVGSCGIPLLDFKKARKEKRREADRLTPQRSNWETGQPVCSLPRCRACWRASPGMPRLSTYSR